jgi:hypothetical protein
MWFDDLLAGAAGLREYMQREERVRSVIGRPYVTRVFVPPTSGRIGTYLTIAADQRFVSRSAESAGRSLGV